jgi:hypothetical protein
MGLADSECVRPRLINVVWTGRLQGTRFQANFFIDGTRIGLVYGTRGLASVRSQVPHRNPRRMLVLGRDRKWRGGIDVIRMRMGSGRGSYGRHIMDPLRSTVHLRNVQVVGFKRYGLDQ